MKICTGQKTKCQLLAHGRYASVANYRTKSLVIFEVYLIISAEFQNLYSFIPQLLDQPLAMFCGSLVGKHCISL